MFWKKSLALAASLAAGLALALTACSSTDDTLDKPIRPSVEKFNEDSYIIFYTDKKDTSATITKVLAPGGKTVFEDEWGDEQPWVSDYIGENGITSQRFSVEGAILTTIDGTYTGTASVMATISPETVPALIEAYNALPLREDLSAAGLEPHPPMSVEEYLYFGSILRKVVKHSSVVPESAPIQFATSEQAKEKAGATMREAFAAGLPAWQVAQGHREYDWNDEYAYDFRQCRLYGGITAGDNSELFAQWSEKLAPELGVTFILEPWGPKDFHDTTLWDGGSFSADSDIPCDIKRVSADGELVPLDANDNPVEEPYDDVYPPG